jgi:hypothetical protein
MEERIVPVRVYIDGVDMLSEESGDVRHPQLDILGDEAFPEYEPHKPP